MPSITISQRTWNFLNTLRGSSNNSFEDVIIRLLKASKLEEFCKTIEDARPTEAIVLDEDGDLN